MRLINKEDVIEAIKEQRDAAVRLGWNATYNGLCIAIGEIINAKTIDAVPVVRCKDCVHRDNPTGQPNILCWQMPEDGFCSYCERKGDE